MDDPNNTDASLHLDATQEPGTPAPLTQEEITVANESSKDKGDDPMDTSDDEDKSDSTGAISEDGSNEDNKSDEDDESDEIWPISPLPSMFVDLPYLPANTPLGCPHVLDLTQERLINCMHGGMFFTSRADVVATILYNYGEDLLKMFLDIENYDYIEFRSHNYTKRDGVKEEGLSVLIIRAWDYVYFSKINNNEEFCHDHVAWIYGRYKWKITADPAQPWDLKSYDSESLTTSWNIIREWHFSFRGVGPNFHYRNPTVQQVPWKFDLIVPIELIDKCWKKEVDLETGRRTDIKIRKAKNMRQIDKDLRRSDRDVESIEPLFG